MVDQGALRSRIINLARSEHPIVRQSRAAEPSDLNRFRRQGLVWRFIGAIGNQYEDDIEHVTAANFAQHFGLSGLVGLEAYVDAVAYDDTISDQRLLLKLELFVDSLIAATEFQQQYLADSRLARQLNIQAPDVA